MTIFERPIDGSVRPIDLIDIEVALGDGPFPKTQFAEVEPIDWRGNLRSIVIGGSCGLGAVLLIGFAVGYAKWGMPWVRSAVEAIF